TRTRPRPSFRPLANDPVTGCPGTGVDSKPLYRYVATKVATKWGVRMWWGHGGDGAAQGADVSASRGELDLPRAEGAGRRGGWGGGGGGRLRQQGRAGPAARAAAGAGPAAAPAAPGRPGRLL